MTDPRASTPPEIIYTILKEISSDIHSLKNCALVSRTFHPHCSKLLFANVYLDTPSKCRSLYRAVFTDVSLVSHIRTLEVIMSVRPACDETWGRTELTLAHILRAVPDIQSFTLRSTQLPWRRLNVELRRSIFELSASCVTLQSFTKMPVGHFGRLSSLRHLHLLDMHLGTDELYLDMLGETSCQARGYLESLEVVQSPICGRHLVTTLTDPRSLLSLSQLKRLVLDETGEFGSAIVGLAATTLEEVVWTGLRDIEEHDPFSKTLPSLIKLPALHSLTLCIKLTQGLEPHSDPLPLIATAFSQAALGDAPALTHLAIHIELRTLGSSVPTDKDTDNIDKDVCWPTLDDALTAPGMFGRLQRVTVILVFSKVPERRLPRLLERGLLITEPVEK